jgi:hypothetical protein
VASQFASFVLAFVVTLGPIMFASALVLDAIAEALRAGALYYPDSQSLHTVTLLDAKGLAELQGRKWLVDDYYWLAAALGATLLFAFVLVRHWRLAGSGGISSLLLPTLLIPLYYVGVAKVLASQPWTTELARSPSAFLGAAAFGLMAYANLRMFPYAGVAVCARSMALKPTMSLTRGSGILGVLGALVLSLAVVTIAGLLVSIVLSPAILTVVMGVGAAVSSYVRFQFGFEEFTAVQAFFAGLVAIANTILNIAWTIFSYAVLAGLWGRLYRDGRRMEGAIA